jgi:hypothetical protein
MWTILVAAATGAAGYFLGRSMAMPTEAEHQALIRALGFLNRRGRSELLSIAKEPSRSVPVPGRPDLMQVTAPVPYFTPEERRIILDEVRAWQQAEQSRTGMPFRAPTELVTDEEIQGIPAVQQVIRPGMEGRFRLIQRWI